MHAKKYCKRGDEILSVPLALCVKSEEFELNADFENCKKLKITPEIPPCFEQYSKEVTFKLVAVLYDKIKEKDPRAEYFLHAAPYHGIYPSLMILWRENDKKISSKVVDISKEHDISNEQSSNSPSNPASSPSSLQRTYSVSKSTVFDVLSNSVAMKRADEMREHIEIARAELSKVRGIELDADLWFWAAGVVRSRCFTYVIEGDGNYEDAIDNNKNPISNSTTSAGEGKNADDDENSNKKVLGRALCPWIDLANHKSNNGDTAKLKTYGDVITMISDSALDANEEVTICYNSSADYLDLFEIYGFFDNSAVIHTAEVFLPLEAIFDLAMGKQSCAFSLTPRTNSDDKPDPFMAQRLELINKQADEGYDCEMEAWWLPDHHLTRAPLFRAVRAALVGKGEFQSMKKAVVTGSLANKDEDPLSRPIAREAEVGEFIAKYLQLHLKGYRTSLDEDLMAQDSLENYLDIKEADEDASTSPKSNKNSEDAIDFYGSDSGWEDKFFQRGEKKNSTENAKNNNFVKNSPQSPLFTDPRFHAALTLSIFEKRMLKTALNQCDALAVSAWQVGSEFKQQYVTLDYEKKFQNSAGPGGKIKSTFKLLNAGDSKLPPLVEGFEEEEDEDEDAQSLIPTAKSSIPINPLRTNTSIGSAPSEDINYLSTFKEPSGSLEDKLASLEAGKTE